MQLRGPGRLFASVLLLLAAFQADPLSAQASRGRAAERRILLIADKPSHGPGEHEHNAAVWLIRDALQGVPGVKVTASLDGWPSDSAAIETADAIFMFCSGANGHEAFRGNRPAALSRAAARGAGLMFYHWCVEPPETSGHQEMLDWIGGYFEVGYSVNPVWEASFQRLPSHPITRGVHPFQLRDEWYYNMRFQPNMRGVTPILSAIPPLETIGPDGPRSGNPDVRAKAGQPQTLLWAYERPGGGRGVGSVGGHYHTNLGDPNFRKLILNSILWIAHADVPKKGVDVSVTPQQLEEHLDPKPARRPAAPSPQ